MKTGTILSTIAAFAAMANADVLVNATVSAVGNTEMLSEFTTDRIADASMNWHCACGPNSPPMSGVAMGAKAIREHQGHNGMCGTEGGSTKMHQGDGVRIYAMGKKWSARCTEVANRIDDLIQYCFCQANGDLRVGGTVDIGDGYIHLSK